MGDCISPFLLNPGLNPNASSLAFSHTKRQQKDLLRSRGSKFVADWADVFQVAVRVGDERLTLVGFSAGFELVES